jgi:hypothetical protein
MGIAPVAPVMAPLVPGLQKPPRRVGKRFRDRLVAVPEGKVKKPAKSEKETRLVAAGPPGCEPGGLLQQRGLPGVVFAAVQALRRLTAMTSSRDSTRMVKEQCPRRRTA